MTGLTAEYILKHDSKEAHCSNEPRSARLSHIENMGYALSYSERGYDQPAKCILFANWNYFSKQVANILERAGYELEWEDEWDTCTDCGGAVRTQPDCHGWEPYYVEVSGDCVCLNCIDWPDYLENCQDNSDKAVSSFCDPAKFGYVRRSEAGQYETGFHLGQDDKPADVLKKYHARSQYYIVFRISGKGQFDISWEVWQKTQLPALKHYIAMNGEHGCMPDSCNLSLERDEAIESLGSLLELSEDQVIQLERAGVVECTREQGAAYCEVVECSCQSPWEHEEGSGGEKRFRDNSPEYFEEAEGE